MLKKLVLVVLMAILMPTLGFVQAPEKAIEFQVKQHETAVDTTRLTKFITLFFAHPDMSCSGPDKISLEIYRYKEFQDKVLRTLPPASREAFSLRGDGIIVWAYSELKDRDNLVINLFAQNITDRTVAHELFHWFIAYCTPIGKVHSEQLVENLSLHYLGTKYYKDWLKHEEHF